MLALAATTAQAAVFAVANARIMVHLGNVLFKLASAPKTPHRALSDLRARRQQAHTLTRRRLDGRRSAHSRHIPTGIINR